MDDWRYFLKHGDCVDCLDSDGKWLESKIIDVINHTNLKIHFRGWDDKYDIFLDRNSISIQPLYSKTYNWRAFLNKGDIVEVLNMTNNCRKWYIAFIMFIDRVQNIVTVQFSNVITKTLGIESDDISYLGSHIKITQTITINSDILNILAEKHLYEVQNKHRNVNSLNSCCICLCNVANVVIMPCKHLCVCTTCSNNQMLLHCPLCKQKINSTLTVYV